MTSIWVSILVAQAFTLDPGLSPFSRPLGELGGSDEVIEARRFLSELRTAPVLGDAPCGTPQLLRVQAAMASDPTHSIIADLQIRGEVKELATSHFTLFYTTDETPDRPPMTDDNTILTMPDGSTRVLPANGVPNYVEAAAAYFEYAHAWFVRLGFRVPDHTDVRVLESERSFSTNGFGISLGVSASARYMPTLCAHEFFHQIQAEYTGTLDLSWIDLDNPSYYDTFGLEGTANAGADLVFSTSDYGSQLARNAGEYFGATDASLWNLAYEGSVFWKYFMEQYASEPYAVRGITVGSEVLERFLAQRGETRSREAFGRALGTFGGESVKDFVSRFRVAGAAKDWLQVDPTVAGELRAYDFVGDNASVWPAINEHQRFELASGPGQLEQAEVRSDFGAKYFRIVPAPGAASFGLRVVAASSDLEVQVVQIAGGGAARRVLVDRFQSRDGKVERTVAVPDAHVASYVVLASEDGTQPYQIVLNPRSSEVPELTLKCAALPTGAPLGVGDLAAGLELFGLIAGMRLVRCLRRRSR